MSLDTATFGAQINPSENHLPSQPDCDEDLNGHAASRETTGVDIVIQEQVLLFSGDDGVSVALIRNKPTISRSSCLEVTEVAPPKFVSLDTATFDAQIK